MYTVQTHMHVYMHPCIHTGMHYTYTYAHRHATPIGFTSADSTYYRSRTIFPWSEQHALFYAFYIRNLRILGFWYPQGVLKPIPMGAKGQLYTHICTHMHTIHANTYMHSNTCIQTMHKHTWTQGTHTQCTHADKTCSHAQMHAHTRHICTYTATHAHACRAFLVGK